MNDRNDRNDKRGKRTPLRIEVDVPLGHVEHDAAPPVPVEAAPPSSAAERPPEPLAPRMGPPVADASALRFDGARGALVDAVYLEAVDRGVEPRTALSQAEATADRLRADGPAGPSPASGFFDLRVEQDFEYPNAARKVRKIGKAVVYREPRDVDTIVVHQTACEFGVSAASIVKAGGNIELARARRALEVACHALAFRHGYFVAAHPLRVYVNHGNRFNDRSLGLEVEGRYAGLEDDPTTIAREDLRTTWGGKPTTLDDATIASACAALRWLVEEGRRDGMPIRYVVAHRQSSDTRRSDPGQAIWRRVVLDFGVRVLGLVAQRGSPWQEGRPIPKQWDPDGEGDY